MKLRKVLKLSRGHEGLCLTEEKIQARENSKNSDKSWQALNLASGLGFAVVLPVVGGAIFGNYLDHKFKLVPGLTLFFLFIGIILSVTNFYFLMRDFIKK